MTRRLHTSSLSHKHEHEHNHNERGNILFMILIAIVLIGALTAVVMRGGGESASIDDETLLIRVSEVQRYASELERAVRFIIANGKSESDLRFAHPRAPGAPAGYGDLAADTDPRDQVFHKDGGAATYRLPPEGITNTAVNWEFYGGTAIPGVGSDRADLVAVLPDVTPQMCAHINKQRAQVSPQDTGASAAAGASAGDCVFMNTAGRFNDTRQFYTSPNTMNLATFAQDPETGTAYSAPEACVVCATDNRRYYYFVLLAR